MSNKSNNEMEQIQQGLEAFLEKELDIIGTTQHGRRKERPEEGQKRGNVQGDGQVYRRQMQRNERPVDGNQSRQDVYRDHGNREPREADWDYGDREPQEAGWDYGDSEPREADWDYRDREPQEAGWDYGDSEPQEAGWDYGNRESQEADWDYGDSEPQDEDWDCEQLIHHRKGHTHTGQISGSHAGVRRNQGQNGTGRKKKRPEVQRQVPREDVQMAKKASKSSKAQKKKKKKFRLAKFLAVVAVLAALLGVGLYQIVGVVYGKMNYREIASFSEKPMQEDGVVNILLIGNDSRENGADGRSDAMILLSVSSKTKTIYLTSLLRDMYVEIPGHDDNRLNAAYSFGGAELLMETVEKNFDIPVNRYVLVNFEGFANLIDTVGGIELELTSEEIEYVNGYLVEYNMLTNRPQGTDNMDTSVSGLVHLNGPQALAYSRNRYLGTDFGRTDRQRKVLTAVIKKVPSVMLTNAGELMDGLLPNLTTNLTQDECFRLSLMAGKLLTYDIVSDSIPQPGTYSNATIRKMAVLEVDFDTNIRYLKEKIYGE
ncbi:MAG: LCP family protein [Lachnospiraceae bacterium]|nr:LCP family protein [Lachnospiraceae bacterium]